MHPASATQDVTSSATQDVSPRLRSHKTYQTRRQSTSSAMQDVSPRHRPQRTSVHIFSHTRRAAHRTSVHVVNPTKRATSVNVITNTKRQSSPSATQDVGPCQQVHKMSAATQDVSSRHQPYATSIHAISYARLQSTSLLFYTKRQSRH